MLLHREFTFHNCSMSRTQGLVSRACTREGNQTCRYWGAGTEQYTRRLQSRAECDRCYKGSKECLQSMHDTQQTQVQRKRDRARNRFQLFSIRILSTYFRGETRCKTIPGITAAIVVVATCKRCSSHDFWRRRSRGGRVLGQN